MSLRDTPLHFDESGNFRIVHITDTHLSYKNVNRSVYLIAKACDDEEPDVIALTGDIAGGGSHPESRQCIENLMHVFEKRNIPVAVCLGNHDTESSDLALRQSLINYYNSFSCSISSPECYNIPVYSHNGDKVAFNLWFFDSGSYDENGRYSNVPEEQIEYYLSTSEKLQRENSGNKVYSLAFQHIVVPDIYDALKRVKHKGPYVYERIYRKGEYYVLNPDNTNKGIMLEEPCSGDINHGQFDAMVRRGDVLAVFSGHDHMNTFSVRHRGMDIVNSPSTRYNSDSFSTQYGYRILDIKEDDTSSYSDRLVQWYDKYSVSDAEKIKKSGDDFGSKTILSVAVNGKKRKIAEFISHAAVYIVTGRKAAYK